MTLRQRESAVPLRDLDTGYRFRVAMPGMAPYRSAAVTKEAA